MGLRIKTILISAFLCAVIACNKQDDPAPSTGPTPFPLTIPAGLPSLPVPSSNPLTVEGVALGRKLFYDPLLSGNNMQSCGSCHNQSHAFTDNNLAFSIGIDGIAGNRNSMPLFNLGYAQNFFWDGGASTLESQVVGPIINPIEMHEDLNNCTAELNTHPDYPSLFKQAFGSDSITISMVMKAIAQFERTILSGNTKYDRYVKGQATLTPQEQNGLLVFQAAAKGDCTHCHTLGGTFTDFGYRNTGLDSIPADSGRARITLNPTDMGKFKTPSLRNIALTAPYMHDGRFTTLQQVIDHYNTGFHLPFNLDPNLRNAVKGRMSQQEMDDLIAFLLTLTDDQLALNPAYSHP
jgi:cytochrome c peroxidase